MRCMKRSWNSKNRCISSEGFLTPKRADLQNEYVLGQTFAPPPGGTLVYQSHFKTVQPIHG